MHATDLGPEEVAALREALDDEHKAWAIYDQMLKDFGSVPPFSNIVQSEARHIAALAGLFERYGVPMPVNPWPGNVPRFASLKDACEAGVATEIENEQLYQRLLVAARRPDIRAVFERLREASQLRHLAAFRRCADRYVAS